MAEWIDRTFVTRSNMIEYLNGLLIGIVNLHEGAEVDNKTLIINVGGAGNRTVTFQPAKSRAWTLAEIIAEISGAHADLVGLPKEHVPKASPGADQKRYLKLSTNDSFVVVKTGTANPLLGFDTVNDETAHHFLNTEVADLTFEQRRSVWSVITYA